MKFYKRIVILILWICLVWFSRKNAYGLCLCENDPDTVRQQILLNEIGNPEYREPELIAQGAVLVDGETGRVLWGKNEDCVLPMASTTKIMTCILALENSDPDAEVQVSDYAASMPDVQLNIKAGESYRMEDLLYSLMLESHNDSAVAIAEHVAGSVEGFADLMNQKARDIGCIDTYFVTPNGLDGVDPASGEAHTTTANELAQIMRYCIQQSPKRDEFLTITGTSSRAFSNLQRTRSFSCINHNALLTTMDGAISGKTGFTNQAGYCYVGAVEKNGKLMIVSLLACGWPPHKNYKWQDMRKLITYGNDAFAYHEIPMDPVELQEIPVERGIKESVCVEVRYPETDGLRVLIREDELVSIRKKVATSVEAPVESGVSLGSLEYYVNDTLVVSYPIVTSETVGLRDLEFCAKLLLKKLLFCYNSEKEFSREEL